MSSNIWTAVCKECGVLYNYSDSSYTRANEKGFSRPERCPSCRKQHTKEISDFGMAYYEPDIYRKLPDNTTLKAGYLGKLKHPGENTPNGSRIHSYHTRKSSFDYSRFGITDDNITQLFRVMKKNQVTIVVGPTGSGKSTFLPFRLMSPSIEAVEFADDIWTRNGQILITQPRIQATKNIPEFVASKLHGAEHYELKNSFFSKKTIKKFNLSGKIYNLKNIQFSSVNELLDKVNNLMNKSIFNLDNIQPYIKLVAEVGIGYDVGYRYSGDKNTDWNNKLVYVTDGTLINWIMTEQLGRFSVIMIDEAHERSLNIDLILGLLKKQLPRYPNLKLLIASATISAENFIAYYADRDGSNKEKIIETIRNNIESKDQNLSEDDVLHDIAATYDIGYLKFQGKEPNWLTDLKNSGQNIPDDKFGGPYYFTYFAESDKTIEISTFSTKMPNLVADKVIDILENMKQTSKHDKSSKYIKGDILAFLHGEKPIKEARSLILEKINDSTELNNQDIVVYPLYTTLDQSDQDLALKTKKELGIQNKTRVVISTNVAETSLTVEGVVHVIETGLINEANWDIESKSLIVNPIIHSQAGCKQRWGRSGRVSHGRVHCLYSEEQYINEFPKYSEPEITRAPLEQLVLTAKSAGIDDVSNFDWIQRPPMETLDSAMASLSKFGALDNSGYLTESGLELINYIEPVNIASLIMVADKFGCVYEMASLLSLLKIGGVVKLLKWDKSWTNSTKLKIYSIHESLKSASQDDLEFVLKLFESHRFSCNMENDSANEWYNRNFIDLQNFEKLISERDKLLQTLSKHKKEVEERSIQFSSLDKVRKILLWVLKEDVYKVTSAYKGNENMLKCQTYEENQNTASKSTVIISDSSIIFSKPKKPESFIGLNKKVFFRSDVLSDEAEKIINISVIVSVDSSWIETFTQKPPLSQTSLINHLILNKPYGDNRRRLFIDQVYPLYSKVNPVVVDGTWVMPDEVNRDRDRDLISLSSDCMDNNDAEYYEEFEGTSISDFLNLHAIQLEKDKIDDSVFDLSEEVIDELNVNTNDTSVDCELTSYTGLFHHEIGENSEINIVPGHPDYGAREGLELYINGYEFDESGDPSVKLGVSPSEQFQNFVSAHKVGQYHDFTVLERIKVPFEEKHYLLVKDDASGFKCLVKSSELSIVDNYFVLNQYKPEDKVTLYIEKIDKKLREITLSRHYYYEKILQQFHSHIKNNKNSIFSGTVYQVNNYGIYFCVAFEDQCYDIILFCPKERVNVRLKNITENSTVKIKINCKFGFPQYPKRYINEGIDSVWQKTLFKYNNLKIEDNEERSSIILTDYMSYQQIQDFNKIIKNENLLKHLNWLYYGQYNFEIVELFDASLNQAVISNEKSELAKFVQNSIEHRKSGNSSDNTPFIQGKINGVLYENDDMKGVVVALNDEYTHIIPKEDIWTNNLGSIKVNQPIKLFFDDKNTNNELFSLTLKDPEQNPIHKLQIGKKIMGYVETWEDNETVQSPRVNVKIDEDISGFIPKLELSWTKINNISQFVKTGMEIKGTVSSIDIKNNKVILSRRSNQNLSDIYKLRSTKYDATVIHLNRNNMYLMAIVEKDIIARLSYTDTEYSIDKFLSLERDIELKVQIKNMKKEGENYQVELTCAKSYISKYKEGEDIYFKVVHVSQKGLYGELEKGGKYFLPKNFLTQQNMTTKQIQYGSKIKVRITKVDIQNDILYLDPNITSETDVKQLDIGEEINVVVSKIKPKILVVKKDELEGIIPVGETSWSFVKDLTNIFNNGQTLVVRIIDLNLQKNSFVASIKQVKDNDWTQLYNVGQLVKVRIDKIEPKYARVKFEPDGTGIIPINFIADAYVKNISDFITLGESYQAMLKEIKIVGPNQRQSVFSLI